MTKTATAVRIPTARRGPAGTSQDTFRWDVEGLRGIAVALIVFFDAGVPGFGGADVAPLAAAWWSLPRFGASVAHVEL
jgi:peptidoglycan/LPS O-acetylase OafA/YrhL